MGDGAALRRVLAGCAIAALVATGGGCGGGGAAPASTARSTARVDPAAQAKLMATGERIFARDCSFCHRLHGRRAPRTPPPDAYGSSFDEIETTRAYVADRVANGFGGMQSFAHELSARQISAVAAYVVANEGSHVRSAAPPPAAQLAAGERVFAARCQRCHSIADRAQRTHPSWKPTDFRVVKPSAAFTASLLNGEGNRLLIELMPSVQGKLAAREIRDVAAYVAAVATPGRAAGG